MDIVYAIVTGILFSVLVFGVKTGAGCGFSSIGHRKVFLLGFSYFIISVLMGALTAYIDMSGLENIAEMGMVVHSVLAILLIGAGIYTSKKWNCGCDVSNHTFLFLSLPCPVCLAALFLSCMVLATTLEVGGLWIGVLVGLVFFLAVICSSYLFRKMGKSPIPWVASCFFWVCSILWVYCSSPLSSRHNRCTSPQWRLGHSSLSPWS